MATDALGNNNGPSENPADAVKKNANAQKGLLNNSIVGGLMNKGQEIVQSAQSMVDSLTFYARRSLKEMKDAQVQIVGGLRHTIEVDGIPQNWESRMERAFGDQKVQNTHDALEEIFKKLSKDIPDATAEDVTSDHPYIHIHGEKVHHSDKRFQTARITDNIYDDMRYLHSIEQTGKLTPEQLDIVLELHNALLAFAECDPGRKEKELLLDNRRNHYTSYAINKMGRITFGLAGVAGVVMFGIPAIMSKGKTGTTLALASGGLFYAAAYPESVRGLLGGLKGASMQELTTAVNTEDLKEGSAENALEGDAGKRLVATFLPKNEEQKVEMETFVDHIRTETTTPEEIKAKAIEVAGTEDTNDILYKNAYEFFKNPNAVLKYWNVLHKITDEDAQQTMEDIAAFGWKRFYNNVKGGLPDPKELERKSQEEQQS